MRLIVVFAIIFNFFTMSVCNNYSEDDRVNQSVAMQFVKLVQKRYYLVHRLEKPIKSLLKFYEIVQQKQHFSVWDFFEHHQHLYNKAGLIKSGTSEQFKHPVVKNYMKAIEEKGDVQSIHNLWSDFLSYKFIENDLFVRETILAIVLLYKDIMLQLITQYGSEDISMQACDNTKYRNTFADEKIEEVTEDGIGKEELYENFNSILHLLDESYEEADFVVNNNMRFYHIQRLFKSIIVLSKLITRHADYSRHYFHDFTKLPFEHETIIFYVDKMKYTQSLEPLFRLWHCVVSYKYINDTTFLKEFVTLLLMIHKQIVIDFNHIVIKEAPSIQELIVLYEQIASMPIPDLLNSLDVIVDQCIEIIEKYELDSSMSWKAWFNKYWWVPPVIISSIVINFFLTPKVPSTYSAI